MLSLKKSFLEAENFSACDVRIPRFFEILSLPAVIKLILYPEQVECPSYHYIYEIFENSGS